MENFSESYHISFFKPTTERARANRNMVLWLVSVWFVAIFGFHIVLKIIEKPVAEPSLIVFKDAWSEIEGGQFAPQDLRELSRSCLSVSGKMDLAPGEKAAVDNAFSWSLWQLLPDTENELLITRIQEFEQMSAAITNISDEEYSGLKKELTADIGPLIGLDDVDVRKTLIPFALRSEGIKSLGEETKAALPGVMEKYLIHNRSVLTDTRFLGFPFHYFYTAVFLLILFVGLCLIYCLRTDAVNKKLEFAD